jgi:hypothetical protein
MDGTRGLPTVAGSSFRGTAELMRSLDRRLRRASAPCVVLLASSVAGCWSERITSLDGLDLFVRFRADGALVEYTAPGNAFGWYTDSCTAGGSTLRVVAWDATTGLGLRLSSRQGSPGPGTWSIAQRERDSTFGLTMVFVDGAGNGYRAQPVVPEDATIMISHVGSTAIAGTFFGRVKALDGVEVTITDGEFVVRREHDIDSCD